MGETPNDDDYKREPWEFVREGKAFEQCILTGNEIGPNDEVV